MRNVLVTGGSRGLGLGIAQTLAAAGFRVVAVARNDNETIAAVREQVARNGRGALHFHPFDLSDVEQLSGLVKSLRGTFGNFYGLVNNAAIGTSGMLSNMPDNAIERLVRLNVLSPLTLTKYVVRSMMASQVATASQGGRIVNVASIVGTTGYSGLSVYSATKASLIGFTRSLAREVGPLGITVNAVSPGFVDTDMTTDLNPTQRNQVARRSALQRMPEVDDIAAAVDFLFSERAKNITGTVMTIDAGNTA
jgi:3-oxoacyl-[acyl-carrier protein] reductase